jgi:hypothetical protein
LKWLYFEVKKRERLYFLGVAAKLLRADGDPFRFQNGEQVFLPIELKINSSPILSITDLIRLKLKSTVRVKILVSRGIVRTDDQNKEGKAMEGLKSFQLPFSTGSAEIESNDSGRSAEKILCN